MRIPRLYLPQPVHVGDSTVLPRDKAHYVAHVLRLRPGDKVIIFNGTGNEFEGSLIKLGKQSACIDIMKCHERRTESPLQIILALAISRGQHMDYALQKSVELGVHKIVPLFTAFSNVRIEADRLENKLSHWLGILVSATEQCGRVRVPQLESPMALNDWLAVNYPHPCLMLNPGSGSKLSDIQLETKSISVLIGPEGGFSEAETGLAARSGVTTISFGPRILRTETAVVSVLSVLQQRWGDLNK